MIFQVNHEKRINETSKSLKSARGLSDKQYKNIKAVGSRPGVLYKLCIVHKTIVCPVFTPILSAFGTYTFKIAKLFIPALSYLTSFS